jgi:hypothetical protein
MAEFDVEELRRQVNRSGFPFQRKVAHLINSTRSQHHWLVESSEHSWLDSESGETGFIDLVLSHELKTVLKLFVECKRPLGGRWIFLVDKAPQLLSRLRTFWRIGHAPPRFGWDDLRFEPLSLEASDCIVTGQDERSPLLERLADGLLRSLIGVSSQEQEIFERSERGLLRIYIPAIVTAAELFVCRVDAVTEISIDGVLADSATFERVGFIRFRKSLASRLNRGVAPQNLHDENRDKERSVLIINSSHLVEALFKINLIPRSDNDSLLDLWPWPWGG